jgi:choice-of-anchor B domain-containing protein
MIDRMRGPRLILALASLAAVSCGGDDPLETMTLPPDTAPARNMVRLAQVELGQLVAGAVRTGESFTFASAPRGAGNWGYTSPDGRRFALTGTSRGLSVDEVTNPSRVRHVGIVEGPESQWREVRTFGTYAYVTTEARGHGIDIVDLRDPDQPRKVRTWSETVQSAHSLWIDTDRQLLFVNGANGRTGGMRVLSLADPENPVEVGAWTSWYVHDSYSRGNVLFAAAINDGFLGLLDVSDPGRITEITRFNTGGRTTHNAWLTNDGAYLFTTDERPDRPLEVWDIRNPLAPRKVAEYLAAAGSIAHNVIVDGDRLLVSHYSEGVHLLDIRNPERPAVLGYYDTFPGPETGFVGAWGAYVFPGTNLIVVSDINTGLSVVEYRP